MQNEWNILVVEDDPDGQAVIAHILEYMQVNLTVANDAEEASNYLFASEMAYTAVIIDLALPGKDGWQLLSDIQANTQTANLPCIAVTAYHTAKLREEALQAGFTSYFAKPIDATSFLRQLERVL